MYKGKNFNPNFKKNKKPADAPKPPRPQKQKSQKVLIPQGGIPSVVIEVASKKPTYYDEAEKRLMVFDVAGMPPTVFPNARKAKSAKWHHVMNSGEPMSHDKWEVVPARRLGL